MCLGEFSQNINANKIQAFLPLIEGKSRLREGKWFAQEPAIVPRKTLRGHRKRGTRMQIAALFL